MSIEIFSQLTATGDQMEQQYLLRKRFCIDHLGWTGRTVVSDMEYDEYDTPVTRYIVWRDEKNIARAMARFQPTHIPYMLADHWPHLVTKGKLPRSENIWEVTRLCVEPSLGKKMGLALGQIMAATEILAKRHSINEYWWVSPKHRIDTILPHNHEFMGLGEQIGDEFCFPGRSDPKNMIFPELRSNVLNDSFLIDIRIAA